jgi:hypothetical protein
METVSLTREIDRPADAVRADIGKTAAFTKAGGFDEVSVDGDRMHLVNRVGLAQLELELRLLDTDHELAYEQVDGLFDEMQSWYSVEELDERRCRVTAETEFTLREGLLGEVLDTTVIRRQRGKELTAQLDWLERGGDEA